jgi:hypothetical protein
MLHHKDGIAVAAAATVLFQLCIATMVGANAAVA